MSDPITQHELEVLYAECAEALDDRDFDRWPSFFVENGSYSVVTKENFDRGWPHALMLCESRGMMIDRAVALKKSTFMIPRLQRRVLSGIRVTRMEGDLAHSRASFAVFETFTGESTTLYGCGRFLDVVGRHEGVLKFMKRTCILDSPVVPNSMPFPL